jgi:hypothetical protein
MKINISCRFNLKVSIIIEMIIFYLILFLKNWVGSECFYSYIFSSVICKVIGYSSIVFYPLLKFKSMIYGTEIAGKNFEILYTICIFVVFLVQILLIILKNESPVGLFTLTSFYEMYYIFFNNKKEYWIVIYRLFGFAFKKFPSLKTWRISGWQNVLSPENPLDKPRFLWYNTVCITEEHFRHRFAPKKQATPD